MPGTYYEPASSPGINWANPVTRGIALSVNCLPQFPPTFNLVSRTNGTPGSDFGRTGSPFGPARGTSVNGATGLDSWGVSLDAASVTIEMVVNVRALYTGNIANIQGIIGTTQGVSGTTLARLGDSSGAGKLNVQLGTGTKFGSYDWTPHFGKFTHLAVIGSGTTGLAYVGGRLVDSGTAGTQSFTLLAAGADDFSGLGRGSAMDYLLLNAWNRPLGAGEVYARAQDWWGHLRPAARSQYGFAGAAPASIPWMLDGDFPSYGYVEA